MSELDFKIATEPIDGLVKIEQGITYVNITAIEKLQEQNERYKKALEKGYNRLYGACYDGMDKRLQNAILDTMDILDIDNKHECKSEALEPNGKDGNK